MALATYKTTAAPVAAPIVHPTEHLEIVHNGASIGAYDFTPPPTDVATRAPFAIDVHRNDVLYATVYGTSADNVDARAQRVAAMLSAADMLGNGIDDQ